MAISKKQFVSAVKTCAATLIFSVNGLTSSSANAITTSSYTFISSGTVQYYTVPVDTYQISLVVKGADGAGAGPCNGDTYGSGGGGAVVRTVLPVTPGQVLSIYAGEAGHPGRGGSGDGLGGWGYERGGNGDPWGSGGGGGSTSVLTGSTPLVIAGGGGGGGRSIGANGGNGSQNGNATGGNGIAIPSSGAGVGGANGTPVSTQSSNGYGGGGGGGYGNGSAGLGANSGYQYGCGTSAYSGSTNGGGGAGGSYSSTPATFSAGVFIGTSDSRVGQNGSVVITPLIAVSYNSAGGTGSAPTQSAIAQGDTFTLASNSLTYPGFNFAGWTDGTNTYQPGSTYTMGSSPVTLTALWVTPPIVYSKPTAPSNVTASISNGTATVSFTPGSSGNLPTYNQIDMLINGQSVGNVCNVTGATSCPIANLGPDAAFSFTVTAVNSKGSATSSVSNVVSYASQTTVPATTTTTTMPPAKQTITCIKGKLTKKVTAISPVCPTGYKKK